MLTPIDIQNKQFKRGFRGYNEDDVNDFLDQIINDYEKLTRENTHLKHELERVKKDNEQYQQCNIRFKRFSIFNYCSIFFQNRNASFLLDDTTIFHE